MSQDNRFHLQNPPLQNHWIHYSREGNQLKQTTQVVRSPSHSKRDNQVYRLDFTKNYKYMHNNHSSALDKVDFNNTCNSAPSRLSRISQSSAIHTQPSDYYLYSVEKHASRVNTKITEPELHVKQPENIDQSKTQRVRDSHTMWQPKNKSAIEIQDSGLKSSRLNDLQSFYDAKETEVKDIIKKKKIDYEIFDVKVEKTKKDNDQNIRKLFKNKSDSLFGIKNVGRSFNSDQKKDKKYFNKLNLEQNSISDQITTKSTFKN